MRHAHAYSRALCTAICLLVLAACGSLNPFQHAKTPLDKAHAALRTLEISQEQVLVLVNDRATPPGVVSALKQASRDATVAARQLGEAALEVEAARAELVAGGPTASGRLQVANEKLLQWTETLLARIASIKSAIKGAR
jgi:hypothetical protein